MKSLLKTTRNAALGAMLLTGCTDDQYAFTDLTDEEMTRLQDVHLPLLRTTQEFMTVMAEKAVAAGTLESDHQRGSGDALADLDLLYENLYDVIERGAVYALAESTVDDAGYEGAAAWQQDNEGQNYLLVRPEYVGLRPYDSNGQYPWGIGIDMYLHEAGHTFGSHGQALTAFTKDAYKNPDASDDFSREFQIIQKDADFAYNIQYLADPVMELVDGWKGYIDFARETAQSAANNPDDYDQIRTWVQVTPENIQINLDAIYSESQAKFYDSTLSFYGLSYEEYKETAAQLGLIERMMKAGERQFHREYERIIKERGAVEPVEISDIEQVKPKPFPPTMRR